MTKVSTIGVSRWGTQSAQSPQSRSCVRAWRLLRSCSSSEHSHTSSVDLAEDHVERSDEGDDVGDEVAANQRAQPLKVAERRRPDAETVRVRRFPVADDEVA